jgi:hypothetical protein
MFLCAQLSGTQKSVALSHNLSAQILLTHATRFSLEILSKMKNKATNSSFQRYNLHTWYRNSVPSTLCEWRTSKSEALHNILLSVFSTVLLRFLQIRCMWSYVPVALCDLFFSKMRSRVWPCPAPCVKKCAWDTYKLFLLYNLLKGLVFSICSSIFGINFEKSGIWCCTKTSPHRYHVSSVLSIVSTAPQLPSLFLHKSSQMFFSVEIKQWTWNISAPQPKITTAFAWSFACSKSNHYQIMFWRRTKLPKYSFPFWRLVSFSDTSQSGQSALSKYENNTLCSCSTCQKSASSPPMVFASTNLTTITMVQTRCFFT